MADEKFQLIHPDGRPAPTMDAWKYDALHTALLQIIPSDEVGTPSADLGQRVEQALTPEQRARVGSVNWATTWVRLDMAARGEIERVPRVTPQRLRRKQ